MKKRIVAMFLAVCFIVTLLPTAAFAAAQETMTGFCGADTSYESQTYACRRDDNEFTETYYSNVVWTLTPNANGYKLTISGTGEMGDFGISWTYGRPWHYAIAEKDNMSTMIGVLDKITDISIEGSITKIGAHTFEAYDNISGEITLPSTVKKIGDKAFNNSDHLTVKLQEGLEEIGESALSQTGYTSITLPSTLKNIARNAFQGDASAHSVNLLNLSESTSYGEAAFVNMAIPDVLYVKDEAQKNKITSSSAHTINRTAFAVVNGGTFGTDTEFEAGKLATPKKEGFKFNGWYETADFSGEPVETAVAGKTYYAKYTEKVKSSITVVGVVSEDEEVNGSLPDAYEEDTITLTNTFDGIPEGKFVSGWEVVEPQGLAIENNSFKMPAQRVKLRAILADEPPEEEPGQTVSGADGGAAAAVILGGAAIGAVTYAVGTQIWMETHLPDGVIPTSREQLALMLWNAAGRPQPAEAALYADISAEAADTQLAARWCVEQGLMKDYGESFKPGKYTFRWQVIKTWNQMQKMN